MGQRVITAWNHLDFEKERIIIKKIGKILRGEKKEKRGTRRKKKRERTGKGID